MTFKDPFYGPEGCVRFCFLLAAIMLGLVWFASWLGGVL